MSVRLLTGQISVVICIVSLAAASPAGSEIETIAQTCGEQLCFYWWPRLPPLDGWHHDREHSLNYSANALALDGFTFANAESVIYARALYKPRAPDKKTLQAVIEGDRKDFEENSPGIRISEPDPIITGDGQKLRTFTFFRVGHGSWERVAYGEEEDFYLFFTVSARSEAGYRKALPAYEQLITRYRSKPN